MAVILVVDDEPEVIELMRDWLTLHRYEVLAAANGTDAIRIAEAQHPDMILLDEILPDINGREVCRHLRSSGMATGIPIIIISGQGLAGGRTEALQAGANDFIVKPVNLEDLGRRMRTLLGMQSDSLKRSERLLDDTVQACLAILPCNVAWLLTIDPEGEYLISRTAAASSGEAAAERFLKILTDGAANFRMPLREQSAKSEVAASEILKHAALQGAAEYNLPLSELRTRGEERIYRACEELNLYFVTVVSLHSEGHILGVLLLGSIEPRDVETTRGQRVLTALVNQAAMAVDNARLMRRLGQYEVDTSRERTFSQAVLDIMGDGLLLFDDRNRIVFANRRLGLMSGYPIDSLVGMPLEDLCHPDHRRRLKAMVSDPNPKQTTSFEFDLIRPDGNILPVLAVLASGKVSRAHGIDEHVLVITDLSEHKAREQVLVKQSQRLIALNRAAQALNSTLSLEDTIKTILTEATTALHAKIASVLLHPPGSNELFFHSAVGAGADQLRGRRIPLEKSIAGFVAAEGLPVLVDDAYKDERFYPEIDQMTGMETRSVAAVPLLVQDEAVGVVQVICEDIGAFNLEDLETLQGLARSAGVAIENASLFGETQRQVRELTLLLQASEAASSTLTLETVLQTVAYQLIGALDVTWCIISSWSPDVDALIKLAEVAKVAWPSERGRVFALSDYSLTRQVVETGQPVVTSVGASGIEPARHQMMVDANYSSMLILPIKRRGNMLGVAELYHASNTLSFTETDIDRCLMILSKWQNVLPNDEAWMDSGRLEDLCQELIKITDTAWCNILAASPVSSEARMIFEAGQTVWSLGQGESFILDETSLRRVALMEKTAVATHLGDRHLSAADRSALPHVDNGSMLAAPLIAHGEAIGLVQLIDIDPRRTFSDKELSLAQAIANVVGNALENGRLYSALARRAAQLEGAYNDLREADRLTDEMIQNISHELRTPLSPVLGYTDMLLADDESFSDDQRRALEIIRSQAKLLVRMVSDIVTVENRGTDELQPSMMSLGALAATAIEAASLEAEKRKIQLISDIPDNLPEIYADEERMLQVFDNLLSNAIKFSPSSGPVNISISDMGHSLQVDVTDQGIGIPLDQHSKIWRRFYQVDGSATRRYNGLGLGLTIVKTVIEKHGGKVSLNSEPGKGSTFTFMIPKIEMRAHRPIDQSLVVGSD